MDDQRKTFSQRCREEMTRDVVFLFQRRRVNIVAVPEGYEHDGEGVIREGGIGEYLSTDELLNMESEDGGGCVLIHWDTESVWLSREESEQYGRDHAYNYPDGWRVYGVPSEGELAVLVQKT